MRRAIILSSLQASSAAAAYTVSVQEAARRAHEIPFTASLRACSRDYKREGASSRYSVYTKRRGEPGERNTRSHSYARRAAGWRCCSLSLSQWSCCCYHPSDLDYIIILYNFIFYLNERWSCDCVFFCVWSTRQKILCRRYTRNGIYSASA